MAAIGTRLFAGMAQSGGVYTSADDGANWVAVNDGGPNQTGVHGFAVQGTDLYAASDDIYLTSNGGTSWKGLQAKGLVRTVAVRGQVVLAGEYPSGIEYLTDAGASWNQGSINAAYVQAIDFVGTSVFAGVSFTSPGITRSDDNGVTWVPAANGFPTNLNVLSLTHLGNQLFAGTAGSGVYTATADGGTWTRQSTGLTDGGDNVRVVALIVVGAKIYAGTDNGVWVSTDNGASWTGLDNGDLPQPPFAWGFAVVGSNLFIGTYTTGVWRHAL